MFESIEQLKEAGFTGFVTIATLQTSKCAEVPKERGVYLIVRNAIDIPTNWKGENAQWASEEHLKKKGKSIPVYSFEEVKNNWVPDAIVIYVGMTRDTLRTRIRAYIRFGAQKSLKHKGGRSIWYLPDSADLLVCWKPTPITEPYEEETNLIDTFRSIYGTRPFANRTK